MTLKSRFTELKEILRGQESVRCSREGGSVPLQRTALTIVREARFVMKTRKVDRGLRKN